MRADNFVVEVFSGSTSLTETAPSIVPNAPAHESDGKVYFTLEIIVDRLTKSFQTALKIILCKCFTYV